MAEVRHVARYLIEKLGPMTTMKLQKLTYYCQAWSLAWDEEPLFDEDFQAWANGPVCSELFNAHRGRYSLDEEFLNEFSGYPFSEEQVETLETVIEHYGNKTPSYLSELTHKERPWKETRGVTPLGDPCNEVISKDLIQEYYSGL